MTHRFTPENGISGDTSTAPGLDVATVQEQHLEQPSIVAVIVADRSPDHHSVIDS